MKQIVFGFSKPKKLWLKPYAMLIMLYDRSNFDHGYIRFRSDRWNTDFIYQSSGSRTNFMGGDYFNSINSAQEEYAIQVSDDVEAIVGALCVSREGRSYPVLMILGMMIKFVAALLTLNQVKINNPFPSKNMDCIGEQAAILSEATGKEIPIDFNSETPKQFRDWLKDLPGMVRIK
jgi:hypothetical protein